MERGGGGKMSAPSTSGLSVESQLRVKDARYGYFKVLQTVDMSTVNLSFLSSLLDPD